MIPIAVNEPILSGREKEYLIECINSGWISSEGPYVKELELLLAKRVNREYGIAVANGSGALDIAVRALEIGKGDEVIMPTFTIISCANAILNSGATPVLVDSYIDTWNMNVEQIESKITSKTKAIMVVHIYGLPCDMDPILNLARKHNLKIIEDAAELIGQTYKGKPCGSFGDISCFSFYPNKHITTGEGGMLLTNDGRLAERCRSLRNLCFQEGKRFVHEEMGWNYRMTNLQAALGVAQIERLDEFVQKKYFIGNFYHQLLSDVSSDAKIIQLPAPEKEYAKNIYWVFGIVINGEFNASDVMKKLSARKIGTRPFFYPMHLQPVFKKMGLFSNSNEQYPVAEMLAEKGFYIPSGLSLNEEKMQIVVKNLKEVLNECRNG
ncbi:MAG: DegT/DnrJ/EryC1/StrS family aminotransferase [Oligoflexia bacterium]|nr:DegT/DnrJ/EryC1/StrS family aminotransferase [Oligoflexia bacterium]